MSSASEGAAGASFIKSHLAEHMLALADELENGSPSIYRLNMREEMKLENSMIARKSIGRPCRNGHGENERVFLVVGATGAGKSTLINGMVNYILGVEWKDDFRFKIITEDDKKSQADSQTTDITAYTFHPMKGSLIDYTFTIIDTPGFGATEGIKRDREITEQIKEFFSILPPQGIDHLDGIGFVTQASQARLTKTQEYIFDAILSVFGKDVSQNIFMMLTFADGQKPPVLEAIKKAKIPSQSDKYFKFNNSALFAEHSSETPEAEMNFDEMFWKMGFSFFKRFFVEFLNMTKQAQQSVRRLDEIALKPNPLTGVEYIDLLIESEKRSAGPGWQQRIKYYEEAKRQAEMLSKVKDERESQKLMQQLSRQGMEVNRAENETIKALTEMHLDEDQSKKWYARFKFR